MIPYIKILLTYLLLFALVGTINAQTHTAYYPQEQIIIEPCATAANTNMCFYEYLAQKVNQLLEKKQTRKLLLRKNIDTLKTVASMILTKKGTLDLQKSTFYVKGKSSSRKLQKPLRSILRNLSISKVIHKKPDSLVTKHILEFNYVVKDTNLVLIPNQENYYGGIIEEAPVYPGCEGLNDFEARQCFQEKMVQHINYHFKYPKEAIDQGIYGEVLLMFVINKNGEIENIKIRAPHVLLEKETRRILSFLPKMAAPAKNNGLPTSIPFSIPISFKLK